MWYPLFNKQDNWIVFVFLRAYLVIYKHTDMNYFKKGWSYLILFTLLLFISRPAQSQSWQIEQLNSDINTRSYDEVAPVISRDEQTMFFTRQGFPVFNKTLVEKGTDLSAILSISEYNKKLSEIYSSLSGKLVTNPSTNSFNQDIWMAKNRKGLLDQVSHPTQPLNNAFPNSVCALFNNEQSAIVINQFPEAGGIRPGFSVTHLDRKGYWSIPEPLIIEGIKNIAPDVSLAIAEEGDAIILSLDHKDAYGGNDLFVAFRTGHNQFGKPVHLGAAVNSQSHEKAPFLSSDGRTLFFSSNRSDVMGGYDLFMVYRLGESWDNWTSPKRFLSPINTRANEGFPCFNRQSGYLYFSSDRNGSSDIFRVSIAPPVSEEVTVVGNILDKNKKTKQSATVLLRSKDSGIYTSSFVSTDGHYELDVPMGKSYQILARKPGYQSNRQTVSFPKSDVYLKDFHINLALKPLAVGETIDLNTIYFQKSTAIILAESHEELTYLSDILNENNTLIISIEGHTDNQGGPSLLQKLSKERAQVIKNYLMNEGGIPSARILVKGHGSTKPLNNNSSELLRQQNRRVEIKVVKVEQHTPNETTSALER